MRVIALGRQNFLFAGFDTGGDHAASIYTIVQTAKLYGLSPETYLRGTLARRVIRSAGITNSRRGAVYQLRFVYSDALSQCRNNHREAVSVRNCLL